jgi:CubicO group peptidase (beta-lactamase class C family)
MRTFTAAVVRVEHSPSPLVEFAVGTLDGEGREPCLLGSPFDLASVTKVFVATALLRLVAQGLLSLDDPVYKHLPHFTGAGKRAVTVWHLLTHSSGLPSLVRLFGPEAVPGDPWQAIFSLPLERPPGEAVVYSDVGAMLLGHLVAEISRRPLELSLRELVLGPLGLNDVSFGPRAKAAATELDVWRGRRIRGEVHDENAAALGGVAGHAGLFGSAESVAALARAFLRPDVEFLPPELARKATHEQAAWGDERRGLGWDLRSPDLASPEAVFSSTTYGHYGFTGTSVWADPRRDLITVLLTNRVFFGRDPILIRTLRRQVFELVAQAYPPRLPG